MQTIFHGMVSRSPPSPVISTTVGRAAQSPSGYKQYGLFSDTELAENAIKDIIG